MAILIVVILIVSSLYLLRPINDPDFFWHLKTGQWTWDNRQLLSKDIFAYTTPPELTPRERIILTSYWMSQVVYYLFFLAGGMNGIIVLRFLVVAGIVYLMFKRRQGDDILYLALLAIFLIAIMEVYPMDRPQVFSFFFFAVLLFFLEKMTATETLPPRIYPVMLPLIMFVWSQSHGGFILGQVTITLYLLTEGIKFIHHSLRPLSREQYMRLLISGLSGLLLSLINPNSYHVLIEFYTAPLYQARTITEYRSTLYFFRIFNDYTNVLYWLLMFFAFLGLLLKIKRLDITQISLLAGTGYFSFTQVRYVPFFLIAALPVIARSYTGGKLLILLRALTLGVAIYSAAFFTWDERSGIDRLRSGRWIDESRFPVKAADFIVSNDLRGNMYNYFTWGGYLIWRLGPQRKVFIDGRAIDENVYAESLIINMAESKGVLNWKSLLERYRIRYIVASLFWSDRSPVPLVNELMKDPDWVLVFSDFNSMIFVRDTQENYQIISRYSIPKKVYTDSVQYCLTEFRKMHFKF